MSLQWTLIASLLYSEIAFIILLTLPLISATRWRQIFKSSFLKRIEAQSTIYFYGLLGLLILAFLDSVREMRKYSDENISEHEHGHLDAQMQMHMKLFRAQRNFYISGFTLLLFLIIKKMISLTNSVATLIASNEASMKQARAANDVANKLIDEKAKDKKGSSENKDNDGNNALESKLQEIQRLEEELKNTIKELSTAKANTESMKSQAESVNKEYDRLMTENQKLQDKLDSLTGSEKKEE